MPGLGCGLGFCHSGTLVRLGGRASGVGCGRAGGRLVLGVGLGFATQVRWWDKRGQPGHRSIPIW